MAGFSLPAGRTNYVIDAAASGTIPALIAAQSIGDQLGAIYSITNTDTAAITLTATSIDNTASWSFTTASSIVIDADATVVIETTVVGSNYVVLSSSMAVAGASATISEDTTSPTPVYPAFLHTNSGALTNVYTNSALLQYTPSTGTLSSSAFNALGGVFYNPRVLPASTEIPGGNNGMAVGPVTIPPGETLQVNQNALWRCF